MTLISLVTAVAVPRFLTAWGSFSKDRKIGEATETASERDSNPEVEIELPGDEDSY